nr:hypothetical protein [Leuconostoc gasicomitatum]
MDSPYHFNSKQDNGSVQPCLQLMNSH